MGNFRSGTTLLSSALNTHENVLVAWQPYWLFFKTCRNKWIEKNTGRKPDPDYPLGDLPMNLPWDRESFSRIFDLVEFDRNDIEDLILQIREYLSQNEEAMNRHMKPASLVSHLHGIDPGYGGDILAQLMKRLSVGGCLDYFPTKVGIGFVGIKETFCEDFIEPILTYGGFPSVALHIIRDPRSVVASRNYGRYMESVGSKYPLFLIIRTWLRSVANYIRCRDRDHYLMVKYEDLVRDPEAEMNRICAALRIEFTPNLLHPEAYRDNRGNQWASNSSFGNIGGIHTGSVNKWRNVLSPDEVEIIEYYCQPEMEALGYQVTTKQFDSEKIGCFQEDMSQVRDWLRRYEFRFPKAEKSLLIPVKM
jgi:hypothetical protein